MSKQSETTSTSSATVVSPRKKAKSDEHDHAGLTSDDRQRLSTFFRSKTIADVAPTLVAAVSATASKPLIVLNETDTMRQALATLNAHGISSAPVRAAPSSADKRADAKAEASFCGCVR